MSVTASGAIPGQKYKAGELTVSRQNVLQRVHLFLKLCEAMTSEFRNVLQNVTFGVLKCAVLLSSPYPGTFVYLGNARRDDLRSVDLWTTLDSTSYLVLSYS